MMPPTDPPVPAPEPAPPTRPMQIHRERARIIAEHNRASALRRTSPPRIAGTPPVSVPQTPPNGVKSDTLIDVDATHAPADPTGPAATGPGALPRAVWRSLRRRWPVLLLTALLGLGVGVLAGRDQAPVYQATTTVFFSLDRGQTVNEFAAGVTYTQDLVPSYAAIATQPLVLDPVITALKLPLSASELARKIDVNTPSATTLIDITVTDADPARAAAIANQVASQLSGVVGTLSPRGPENTPSLRVTATSPATESTRPVAVNPNLLTASGLLAGLLLGLVALVIIEAVTRPVRHRQDLARLTSAPVLGAIAADRQAQRHPLPLLTDDDGQRAEDFRYLRANLGLLGADAPRCVLVTSPMPQEGRTSVAINLAIAMSRTSRRTLLIDADLRSPSVGRHLEIAGPGLSAVLGGTARLDVAIWRRRNSSLSVLPAGEELPTSPGELLASDQMRRLLDTVQSEFDLVIIDTPPMLSVADAASVAALTGQAVMVVRTGKTRGRRVTEALNRLDTAGAKVFGVVVNAERRPRRRRGYRGGSTESAAVAAAAEPRVEPRGSTSPETSRLPLDAAAR
jgi:polysaccharide biosynthesis transport protein